MTTWSSGSATSDPRSPTTDNIEIRLSLSTGQSLYIRKLALRPQPVKHHRVSEAEYCYCDAEYRNDTTPGVRKIERSRIPLLRRRIPQRYHAGREEDYREDNDTTKGV